MAELTGETIAEAVKVALRERLAQVCRRRGKRIDRAAVDAIVRCIAEQPVPDERTPDDIIGYDEHGLPR